MAGQVSVQQSSGFTVQVYTGERAKDGAGITARVKVVLHGDNGEHTDVLELSNLWTNDFKRGSAELFPVPADKMGSFTTATTKVSKIEMWRDNLATGSEWFIDRIVVESHGSGDKFVFPFLRWVKATLHYHVNHLDTCLPQSDSHRDQREDELKIKRADFEYMQQPGYIQVNQMPRRDEPFSADYLFQVAADEKAKLVNLVRSKDDSSNSDAAEMWSSVDEIAKLYDTISYAKPSGMDKWNDDVHFGQQRLTGVNHDLIKRVTTTTEYFTPEKFPVTDELPKVFLELAVASKRLFICDLDILENIPTKESAVLCAPIALFFQSKTDQLMPIAIQLFQKPGPENPIFTPADPTPLWTLVKMWYNHADAAYHQAVTHLGRTHFLMEGVHAATNRQLSHSHPLFKLISPHFLPISPINNLLKNDLITDGGWLDRTMSYGSKGLVALINKAFTERKMNAIPYLPDDLQARGMDAADVLPFYHARNDAVLLHNAIETYVRSYVDVYYTSKDLLQGDVELQRWARELSAPMNGDVDDCGLGLRQIPGSGSEMIEKADLVKLVASILYTCSVAHTSASRKLYDQYAFPPNYPATLSGTPPTSKTAAVTEQDVVAALPSVDQTLDVVLMSSLLSQKTTNGLGQFELPYICDPKAVKILESFQAELSTVSSTIKERNTQRLPVYDVLLPETLPNAITI